MQYYHQRSLLLGLLLLLSTMLFAQKIAKAKNIGFGIEQNKAIIHYDIKSPDEFSQHSVHLKFIDKQYYMITPLALSGDVGLNILGGTNKTIEWDIAEDFQSLDSKITPVLFVDGVSKEFSKTGGPNNALLSVLLPGLGDYFVADHRLMTFKPYLRTISSLGFIGLGIYAGNQRYNAEGYFETILASRAYNSISKEKYTEIYREGDLQYWIFKGDKEVFITLGAAIWFADIIWVLAKGTNNENFLKELRKGSDFSLGYHQGDLSLKYSFSF